MFSSRSFSVLSWTVLLVSVSSLVSCTNILDSHVDVFLQDVFDHISNKREKECQFSKSGSLSVKEQGTAINRVMRLDTSVSKLQILQEPFEVIAEKSQKKNGLNEILKKITGTDKFLEILNQCRAARSKPRCDAKAPYRSYDGTCNNLKHPRWGSVLSCNERILKAYYEGTAGFRLSFRSRAELPNPRYLSLYLLTNHHYPTKDVSNLFTMFGQLVDHDITNTAPTTANGGVLQCCPPEENAPAQCAPIIISPDDPFYSYHNITCINFVRNAPCPTCAFGKRVQINSVTAFIDASVLYSTSEETVNQLRTGEKGMLKMHDTDAGQLLPPNPNTDENQCGKASKEEYCFKAGDPRANQHTPLMSLQTILARFHNKIAKKLGKINPDWDDETLFQESRKIVIAILQNIIYKEYLPLLLGEEIMTKYNLWIDDNCCTKYDSKANPAMLTEFNTAAFRLHPMVNFVAVEGGLKFRFLYNLASIIYRGHMDELVLGMTKTPSQQFKPHLVDDVKNYLYRPLHGNSGLDLSALNLQRGRDHGLPPYCDVLEHFMGNKTKINTFEDLEGYICYEYIELLKECYEDVRDIDLWPGLLMECSNENGILGATSAHIVAMQFKNLQIGDRFFFNIKDGPGSFPCEQLKEIKKSTLSGVICETTDIKEIHEKSLLLPSHENPLLPCSEIPNVNLEYWNSDSSTDGESNYW